MISRDLLCGFRTDPAMPGCERHRGKNFRFCSVLLLPCVPWRDSFSRSFWAQPISTPISALRLRSDVPTALCSATKTTTVGLESDVGL